MIVRVCPKCGRVITDVNQESKNFAKHADTCKPLKSKQRAKPIR